MSDVAAHLVDDVFPEVPVRQWVCSLPWRLRYAMGYDRRLCADVLGAFIGALTRSLRWRAKRQLGLRSVKDALAGAVTFVQRSDSALRLNPHFHSLVLDGVYVRGEDGELEFHPLGEPSGEEVAQVAAWTHAKLLEVLERNGRSLEGVEDAPNALREEPPVLASCYDASAADVQLLGAPPARAPTFFVRPVRLVPSPNAPLAGRHRPRPRGARPRRGHSSSAAPERTARARLRRGLNCAPAHPCVRARGSGPETAAPRGLPSARRQLGRSCEGRGASTQDAGSLRRP